MGKVTGFMEIDRQVAKYQPASDRIRRLDEVEEPYHTVVVGDSILHSIASSQIPGPDLHGLGGRRVNVGMLDGHAQPIEFGREAEAGGYVHGPGWKLDYRSDPLP